MYWLGRVKQQAEGSTIVSLCYGMQSILEKLNMNKSPGPDGLYSWVLRELGSVFSQATVPDVKCLSADWSRANMVTVFKKGRAISHCC